MADALIDCVGALLEIPQRDRGAIGVEPFHTGGNNRVFIVRVGGRKFIAKQYFRHPSDPRNRLESEQAFLRYAERTGISGVPRIVACDTAQAVALHEYIEGRKLDPAEISSAHVMQAARFFLELNDGGRRHLAEALPLASEACFSVAEHISLVDSRVARLAGIGTASAIDHSARDFSRQLGERWNGIRNDILAHARERGPDINAPVEEKCISPSDFGFHNALLRDDGKLCFLDFEYAGWDDPAKMAGDFFSHPGVPVPADYFDEFLRAAMSYSRQAEKLALRTRLLAPLFRIKWCCIILNEFIPDAARRRRFADPAVDESPRKKGQLEKARRLLDSISDWKVGNGVH